MQKGNTSILDPTDVKILNILQQEGRLDVRQIASRVHKSPSTAHDRIHKLQEKGYIQRYVAVLDRRLVGRPTLMVALVKLNQHSALSLRDFAFQMQVYPEVQLCLHLSGEFDFLLQVSLCDPQEYDDFLHAKLCVLPMVEKVQSSLVLKECKAFTALPLL